MTLSPVESAADPTVEIGATGAATAHRLRLGRFFGSKAAVVALVYLILLVAVAVCAPWVVPEDPNKQDLLHQLAGPSGHHWLGTDSLGRDQLSRVIYGARVSLLGATEAVAVAVVFGVPLGMFAGFAGRWIDTVLSRLMDALLSVPALIMALTIVALVGRGLAPAMFSIGVVFVPVFFRVARATTREIRQETYIEASLALGCSRWRVISRHVVPNAATPTMIQAFLAFGTAVIAEASLSFLGVGVQAPTASWGSMLTEAQKNILVASYLTIPPGVLITLTVLAFSQVGEGLRVALGIPNVGRRRFL